MWAKTYAGLRAWLLIALPEAHGRVGRDYGEVLGDHAKNHCSILARRMTQMRMIQQPCRMDFGAKIEC